MMNRMGAMTLPTRYSLLVIFLFNLAIFVIIIFQNVVGFKISIFILILKFQHQIPEEYNDEEATVQEAGNNAGERVFSRDHMKCAWDIWKCLLLICNDQIIVQNKSKSNLKLFFIYFFVELHYTKQSK